ncbi:hypothetical protein LIPSTDRAFT_225961 [Lipomyces starkeyi NRRL Y-11557]|uniref:Uncharacterized protein n=1 Tax=Lipomyces starkeyi NRRL Y-11557 TaxID=675824 RepID=A0A1E3PTS5_LIPST|nr:hypothetical protein LIPSTDRAFT_225961 [Lipomyces starkeyi NRRL Y-11557]
MTASIRERKVSTLSTKALVDSMGDDLGDLVILLLLICCPTTHSDGGTSSIYITTKSAPSYLMSYIRLCPTSVYVLHPSMSYIRLQQKSSYPTEPLIARITLTSFEVDYMLFVGE